MQRKVYLWVVGVVILTLVACLSLPALTGAQTTKALVTPKKQFTLGLLMPNARDTAFNSVHYGVYTQAQAMGGHKVVMYDAGGYQYFEKQIRQMEDLVQMKVDGILLIAASASATVPAVEEAVAAKIPVLNFMVKTAAQDKLISYIESDQNALGGEQGKYIAQKLNGKGNVVLVPGVAGNSAFMDRVAGFNAVIKGYPGIKVLAERHTDADRGAAMKLMEDYMQTFQQIDGVFTANDILGQGVGDAVVAAGKKGKIVVTTCVIAKDTETMVRNGVIGMTAAQQLVVLGKMAAETMIKHLNGEKIEKLIKVPVIVITNENIDKVDFSPINGPSNWRPPS
jgi:inositol transport system substrate-binding protein